MISDKKLRDMSHLIYRRGQPSETSPPWVGIEFRHKIGSDQLFNQLRDAYPNFQTFRQRKHQAIIEFLRTELKIMQLEDAEQTGFVDNIDTKSLSSARSLSGDSQDLPGDRSTSHSVYSPSTSGSRSPLPPITHQAKPSSEHDSAPQLQPRSPNTAGRHFVFSAHDGRNLNVKTKRKMTNEERQAYKETRKRGACKSCKRTKAKCVHTVISTSSSLESDALMKGTKRPISEGYDQDLPKIPKPEGGSDVHFERPVQPQTMKWLPENPPTFTDVLRAPPPDSNAPVYAPDLNRGQWVDGSGLEDRQNHDVLSFSRTSSNSDGSSGSKSPTPTPANTNHTSPARVIHTSPSPIIHSSPSPIIHADSAQTNNMSPTPNTHTSFFTSINTIHTARN